MNVKRRSIFLCHNRHDKPFVRRVNRSLSKMGIRTWFDEAEILPGDSLLEKIEHGIRTMNYLGVFLSPDSIRSNWVKRELNAAITREIKSRKVRVIPLLLKGLLDKDIPIFLADKYFIDFREGQPFQKGIHELLMVLLDEYAEYLSKAIEELEEPNEFAAGVAGLISLHLPKEIDIDVKELAMALHYRDVFMRICKLMKIEYEDFEKVAKFLANENSENSFHKLAELLKEALPYPLWQYLVTPDALGKIFGIGKYFKYMFKGNVTFSDEVGQ